MVFNIQNLGEVTVEGAVVNIVYQGDLLEAVDIGTIEGNETIDIRRTLQAQRHGTESIAIALDPDDIVWESDEGNNIAIIDFKIGKGDSNDEDGLDLVIPIILLIAVVAVSVSIAFVYKKVKKTNY